MVNSVGGFSIILENPICPDSSTVNGLLCPWFWLQTLITPLWVRTHVYFDGHAANRFVYIYSDSPDLPPPGLVNIGAVMIFSDLRLTD